MQKSSYNFLVLEDDLNANQSIINRMKPYNNWNCIGQETILNEAILKIEKFKPQLLFLDWEVVGGNTFTLLEKITTIENYSPYIIYFTGYQSDNPQIPVDIVNKYKVNRYLIKPIFEDLTNNLATYINEAEDYLTKQKADFWITTIKKEKIKIHSYELLCITQSEVNSRHKIIYTTSQNFEIKSSWELCEAILKENQIDYAYANARYTLINKKYITKIQKPYVWLNHSLKIEVTKDKWRNFE